MKKELLEARYSMKRGPKELQEKFEDKTQEYRLNRLQIWLC